MKYVYNKARDLPHIEVADDYPGIHFRVVTAKVLPYVGVLPVENTAIQHWRVSTAFYVGEQLGPDEVPHGIVETCELPLVIVRRRKFFSVGEPEEQTGREQRKTRV